VSAWAPTLLIDEIAARLDTRRKIVSKWQKRFFEQGLAGLERPRIGRLSVFPPEVQLPKRDGGFDRC
jgi:transposase